MYVAVIASPEIVLCVARNLIDRDIEKPALGGAALC